MNLFVGILLSIFFVALWAGLSAAYFIARGAFGFLNRLWKRF
jgi:hypothetical protein